MNSSHIKHKQSKSWQLKDMTLSYNILDYHQPGKSIFKNDTEYVRLHFGLHGSYTFSCSQLNKSYSLTGHHNNILYTNGLEMEVVNHNKHIETFGINISKHFFLEIAQNGNEPLKRFAEKVDLQKNTIFTDHWSTNHFKIQQVIEEIIHCPYEEPLKNLFLLSKSIELLVLQADCRQNIQPKAYIQSKKDKSKLIEAKEILASRLENPPTIHALAKLIAMNEFKLKKGFKELFGTTIYGYFHHHRMNKAKFLLLDTDKTAKEIAFEIGYSSPQHFSKAFKKKFGATPDSIRKTPDLIIENHKNGSTLP